MPENLQGLKLSKILTELRYFSSYGAFSTSPD